MLEVLPAIAHKIFNSRLVNKANRDHLKVYTQPPGGAITIHLGMHLHLSVPFICM